MQEHELHDSETIEVGEIVIHQMQQVDDDEVDFALHDVMQPDLYDEIDDCDFLLIYLELHNLMLDDDEEDDEMVVDYECADDEIDE